MKKILILVGIIFLISGCSTLEINVDNDPDYNFSSLSKFNVMYKKKDDGKDFTRSRLSKTLSKYFIAKGYTKVPEGESDFSFMIHLNINKRSEIETNYQEIGVTPRHNYYNRRPYGLSNRAQYYDRYTLENRSSVSTTSTYEYEEGHLVIEVLDRKENAVFWQSTARDELSGSNSSQEEVTKYINMLLEKMFANFPKKH